jgi:hypothetical protein
MDIIRGFVFLGYFRLPKTFQRTPSQSFEQTLNFPLGFLIDTLKYSTGRDLEQTLQQSPLE